VPAFFNALKTLQGATLWLAPEPTGASVVVQVQTATSPPTLLFTLTITSGNTMVQASGAQISGAR
jgi:hypothetical protein